MFGFQAATNMDGLVETCRHAAHTQHSGKTPDQAKEEFKEHVAEFYAANGDPVPGVVGSVTEREPLAPPTSGSDSSGSYFSAQSQLGELPVTKGDVLFNAVTKEEGNCLKQGSRTELEIWSSRSVTVASDDALGHDKPTLGENDRLGSKARSGIIKAPVRPSIFSKEWWTPPKGLAVATATSAGVALLAGGIYLLNKYFRRKKTGHGKRIHARSWNIERTDFVRF